MTPGTGRVAGGLRRASELAVVVTTMTHFAPNIIRLLDPGANAARVEAAGAVAHMERIQLGSGRRDRWRWLGVASRPVEARIAEPRLRTYALLETSADESRVAASRARASWALIANHQLQAGPHVVDSAHLHVHEAERKGEVADDVFGDVGLQPRPFGHDTQTAASGGMAGRGVSGVRELRATAVKMWMMSAVRVSVLRGRLMPWSTMVTRAGRKKRAASRSPEALRG